METHHHEWILTNRKGGYALGTGNLINQRKYHGLLIASDENFQRNHLVAGMEEKVEWRGETFNLDSNNYSNCVFPEGFLYLVKPWLRPYPIFLYSALPHQNDILIRKELFMDQDSNTIVIRYTNLGHHKIHLQVHPKYTMINHHEINEPGSLDQEEFETEISGEENHIKFSARRCRNRIEVHGYCPLGQVTANRYTYYNVYYPWEVMKGYPGIGDQITLFEINLELGVGEERYLVFSDEKLDPTPAFMESVLSRYQHLPLPHDYPSEPDIDDSLLGTIDYEDSQLFDRAEYLQILEFALQDFVANDDIVAGYPWYGAWGRDTMVVLNALLHSKDYLPWAERILKKYSLHIKDGLIPNMLPESGRELNYDSIDATLWYIILLYKLGKRKKTVKFWSESARLADRILATIATNQTYPFHLRKDGLLELHPEFAHATWMDICLDGKPVTPRDGAPVEINALWYNAICSYESMVESNNKKSKKKIKLNHDIVALKPLIKESFQKFWLGDYLADIIKGDEPSKEFRPNALLATSLPWQLLSREQAQLLFEKSFNVLYTYYGIRSLDPAEARFRKKYYGLQCERDLSAHNGSVWAWLLGPFCGAYLKAYEGIKPDKEIAEDLSNFVGSFRNGFMKGHIATLAELWDGDAPHFPKGAPAMAWSMAALYNVETYIESLEVKQP